MVGSKQRFVVVRRWRGRSSTLTVHQSSCPSIRRAEVANYVHATSPLQASIEAYRQHAAEVSVGVARWGAECARCGD